MRPLSVPELLSVWERGLAAHPCDRALALLSAASPESSREALTRVSIGRRDAGLLTLREWAFGSELAVVAACPQCGQALETLMQVHDLRAADPDAGTEREVSLTSGSYSVRGRPPNTEDLLISLSADADASRRKLFDRCILEAFQGAEPVEPTALPAEVVRQVVERIAASDPQADTRIEFTCPDCRSGWTEVFDIVSFFWAEIDAWARRVLREVNLLARAYGWSERDILSLSPVRRQIYLAMAQA